MSEQKADPGKFSVQRLEAAVARWFRKQRPAVIGFVVIAALWQLSTYFLPPIITPPLQDIGIATWHIFTRYNELIQLLTTGARVIVSIIASFLVGVILGMAMGTFDKVREYVKPQLNFIQGIPSVSWVVFAAIWFVYPELRIGFIIFIVSMPAFALYTDSAVRGVNVDLIQLSQGFRATELQRFRMVIIPAITPALIGAWAVNIGQAVRVAMVAELIGSNIGVGFQLLEAQSVFDMAGALAWTLSLVALLSVFQLAITLLEMRLLRWRPRAERA